MQLQNITASLWFSGTTATLRDENDNTLSDVFYQQKGKLLLMKSTSFC